MRLVVLVALAGCGRVAFDEHVDSSTADAVMPCNEPWSAPTQISLGAGFFTGPSLRGDGLELYVSSNGDIHVATRSSRDEPFGTATPLPSPPNTAFSDTSPAISDDGLELMFINNRMGNAFVHRSVRASLTSPWGPDEQTGAFGSPDLSSDRLTVFSSDYMSPIRRQTRMTVDAPLSAMIELPAPVDARPALSSLPAIGGNDLELYFQSDRDGITWGLYVARRADPTAEFSTVERIDMPGFFTEPEISADGHFLYFEGNDGQIYMASRCE